MSVNGVEVKEAGGRFWVRLLGLLRGVGRGGSRGARVRSGGGVEEQGMREEEGRREVEREVRERRERGEMVVLIIDEVDAILPPAPLSNSACSSPSTSSHSSCTSPPTLLRSLLDLTYATTSSLITILISNNTTLLPPPSPSTSPHHHPHPHHLLFTPYTPSSLLSILIERLTRTPSPSPSSPLPSPPPLPSSTLPFFHPSALTLVTRSVGGDTGDVRRVLRDVRGVVEGLIQKAERERGEGVGVLEGGWGGGGGYEVTAAVMMMGRVKAGVGGRGGKVRELSHQQASVLWVVGVKGGGKTAGLFECYKRVLRVVRGALAELNEGELCSVVDVLESVGMVRRERGKGGGRGQASHRVECAVTLEGLRRELKGDLWPQLWAKLSVVKQVPWA